MGWSERQKEVDYFNKQRQTVEDFPKLQNAVKNSQDAIINLNNEISNRQTDVRSLQINIDTANAVRAINDNLIQNNIDVLAKISVEQNHLIEGLISKAQNNIDKIRQLEEQNKNLQDFKDQVCDSGIVDCSGQNLQPEPEN